MEKSEHQICSMPKCKKETFDSNLRFCGEHQRNITNFKKVVIRSGIGVVGAGVTYVVKQRIDKS